MDANARDVASFVDAEVASADVELDASVVQVGDAAAMAPDAGDVLEALATYCAELTEISYRRRAECYGGSPQDYRLRDAEGERYSGCAALVEHVRAGRLVFDRARAADGLRELDEMSCAAVYERATVRSWADGVDVPRLTEGVMRGGLGDGDVCTYQAFCADGMTCVFDHVAWASYCRATPVVVVQPGEACDQLRRCDGWCEWNLRDQRCGEPGSCLAYVQAGARCDDLRQCAPGTYCDRMTSRCALSSGEEGAPCDRYWGVCTRPDLDCATDGVGYTCQPRPRIGEPCAFDGPRCLAGRAVYTSTGTISVGTCELRGLVGAACRDSWDCWSGSCVAGTCRIPGAPGDACTTPEECTSDICSEGVCQRRPPADPPECR